MTLLMIVACSSVFSKPRPQVEQGFHSTQSSRSILDASKSLTGGAIGSFSVAPDNTINLKKGDKYNEFLKIGLERKNRKNINA